MVVQVRDIDVLDMFDCVRSYDFIISNRVLEHHMLNNKQLCLQPAKSADLESSREYSAFLH